MKITNKGLYWGLILTFGLLYVLVAYVSTLHAIDFFKLSNNIGLAVLLGVAYELGQASVLFSILMTKNKDTYLPWILMVLLTALQVTANVFASYKHMSLGQGTDWTYWYTSILKIFGVTGGNPETYQVIISWISGALLPVVALGMTALVAQNIKMVTEGEVPDDEAPKVEAKDIVAEVSKIRPTEYDLKEAESVLAKKTPIEKGEPFQKEEQVEKTKIVNDNIQVKVETKPESPVEVDMKERISTTLKDAPIVDISNLIKENVPDISNEALLEDEINNKEIEDHLNDEVSQLTPEIEPEVIATEVEPEVIEPIETKPGVDIRQGIVEIKNTNGLIDVDIKEFEPAPMTRDLPDDAKEITLDEAKRKEEERLERLREIAREKLKKK